MEFSSSSAITKSSRVALSEKSRNPEENSSLLRMSSAISLSFSDLISS